MLLEERPNFRKRAFTLAAVSMVIVFILWNVTQLDIILYPFRLFVTFVHESGHGLAALVSGGHFEHFVVEGNGSGYAITRGGSRLLILPAGYLGAALFGAVLFYLVNSLPYSRQISIVLGIVLLMMTALFARIDSVAFFIGLLSAIVLVAVGYRGGRDTNILLLNILAIMTGLNAVFDLLFLINHSNVGNGRVRNDAAAFADHLGGAIPASLWALLWAALAIAMLALSVYWSLMRPWRKQ